MAYPWPDEQVARYTAYRVDAPLTIDGNLDEAAWQQAPRSPRFVDLVSGARAVHDTRAAVLWDDDYLHVGYWVEEPVVAAQLTERDSLVYTENDVELFVAGQDAYYELQLNALGTVYEALFIWDDGYEAGGYAAQPGLRRDAEGARRWDGVGFAHPRGGRTGFFRWDLPGLRTGVQVDGVLNDASVRDRGWTVEVAVPWAGLEVVARGDGRSLPPADGDVWRMDFSRFNTYREAPPAADSSGWAWSAHGVWDSHVPEVFPYIQFSNQLVGEVEA
ncbi:MAG TPA: carbohydrate-binding family 9-like protein [Propionibacteriaceae bacterium]|nr:carbohydrate-binding family 9-like protein [Propionibacteriaceae bacterium]